MNLHRIAGCSLGDRVAAMRYWNADAVAVTSQTAT